MKNIQLIEEQIESLSKRMPVVIEGDMTTMYTFFIQRDMISSYERKLRSSKLEISRANQR